MLMPSRKPRRQAPDAHTSDSSSHSRGRPMKRTSELKPSLEARRQRAKVTHAQATADMSITRRTELSTFESLPVEIIQQIFFHSFEVNMPRASPYLAHALANPSIYNALILFAYFDSDEESPVETRHFLPAEYRHVNLGEKIRLQQGILNCRWCTLARLKSCMPTLSRLQMVQAWHREHNTEEELQLEPEALSSTLDYSSRHGLSPMLPELDDDVGMETHFLAKSFSGDDLSAPSAPPRGSGLLSGERRSVDPVGPVGDAGTFPRIIVWAFITIAGQPQKILDEGVSIMAVYVIPDHVLAVPAWTEERLTLVQLLRQGLRFLRRENVLVISVQALFKGMATAIHEGNEAALLVLLELHYAMRKIDQGEPEADGGTTLKTRTMVGPFAHPLPLQLFHLACARPKHLHPGPNLTARLLSLLIREGLDTIPFDDPYITHWAIHASESSPSSQIVQLARWLLRDMAGSTMYDLRADEPLFVNGALTRRQEQMTFSYLPFPEVTFTQEIGYLCGHAAPVTFTAPDGGPCG
ncbi:hypothetical protein LTR47_005762 [Exophiala xenobiotica]|nr:hypothetical protein LTR47_005762 [Exophiala xenobiotica]KAK5242196.1 hypothetical protein LTS06_011675 [Exophiala xenobiotica]KAK5259170.1 hypothetical protein LTR40_006491 [Exophiala xenobiotica]KAK5351060.1 hypothetical protein LTR61_005413 [Exophiala xenobiotica]KAK5374039.1 hypothetical protein LTS03_006194 [Exophiala xenobiotica]